MTLTVMVLGGLLTVRAVKGEPAAGSGRTELAAPAAEAGRLPAGAASPTAGDVEGTDGTTGTAAADGTAGTTGSPPSSPPDPAAVLDEIGAAAGDYGVVLVGVSLTDLRTGAHWALNGGQQLSFMSSAKFPWVAIATSVAGPDAVEDDARAVFATSDNDAAEHLIELGGGLDAIDDWWYPALGMTSTCHQQWLDDEYSGTCGPAQSPAFDAAGLEFRNFSTADDMTEFLARLWRDDIPGLTADERQAVLDWSLLSPRDLDLDGDGTLTGELPAAVRGRVYHKVGWDFDYLSASDIGIVDLPQTTYAVSLAAFEGSSSGAQQQFLAWASCRVYVAMSGDGAWPCDPRPEAG